MSTSTKKLVLDIIARDNASATLRKLGVTADGSVDKMALLNKASRAAAVGLAAWSAAAVLSVKAAAEESAEQAKLAQTLEKSTGATAEQAASTDAMLTKMGLATGVADDKLRPALSKLAISTGDLTVSQDLLGVALDASVALGKDVETVAVALGKAYNGNVGALGRLGISTKDAAGQTKDFSAVLADLKAKTEGAAAAAGEAAPWARLQVSIGEAQESIGGALLPAVSSASNALANLGPGAIQAGFAVTGVGLAAVTVVPKVIEFRKAIEGITWAEKAYAVSTKAAGYATVGLISAIAAGKGIEAVGLGRSMDETADSVADLQSQLEDVLAPANTTKFGQFVGGMIDGLGGMKSQLDADRESLGAFDDRLAAMVSGGNADAAAAQWAELVKWGKEHGVTVDELTKAFPQYTAAVAESAGEMDGASKAAQQVSDSLADQAKKVDAATDAWKAYIGLPLDAAAAEIDYRDAVKSATEAIADSTRTRDEKRQAVIDEIQAAERLREAEISNGTAVRVATDRYNDHVDSIREAADKAGLLRGKTDDLRDALRRLPPRVRVGFSLYADPGADQVRIRLPNGVTQINVAGVEAYAAGGWARAAAGAYWVGEHGPELLTLTSSGGRVTPHSQSMRAATDSPIVVNVSGALDPTAVGKQIKDVLTTYKRNTGGAALGLS